MEPTLDTHTKETLKKFLEYVGFEEIKIDGVQRLHYQSFIWLSDKKPGGHKSKLSVINNKKLFDIYEKLFKINATDTLVASAEVK